mgnify:CR=1 FL=1
MMTDKEFEVFQQLMDQKLLGLHNEIINGNKLILEKIEGINNTVLKQNSRINKLEDHRESMQSFVDRRVIDCPHLSKFDDCSSEINKTKDTLNKAIQRIEKSLEDVLFFVKHPKLFISILVAIVLLALASFIDSNPFGIFNFDKQAYKVEQTR